MKLCGFALQAAQLACEAGETLIILTQGDQARVGWVEVENASGASGWVPENYLDIKPGAPAPQEPSSDGLPRYRANFPMVADRAEFLSFKGGDIILVTNQDRAEWWCGYLENSPSVQGYFPANYVSEAPAAAESAVALDGPMSQEIYVVLAPFEPQQASQLRITKGMELLMCKVGEGGAKGWCEMIVAKDSNTRGWIPQT